MPCLSWAGLGAFGRKWYFIGSKGLKALAQMLCFIQSHPQLVETVPWLAHLCVLRRVLAHKQAGCQGQWDQCYTVGLRLSEDCTVYKTAGSETETWNKLGSLPLHRDTGMGGRLGNTCILKLCLLSSFILDVLAHGREQWWYQAAMSQLPGSASVKALIFFPGSWYKSFQTLGISRVFLSIFRPMGGHQSPYWVLP